MLGANTTIGICRSIKGSNGQSTYASPHATLESYREPEGDGIVLAQGAPVGSLYRFFVDLVKTPTVVQVSDLVIDNSAGDRGVVSGIERYENHLVLHCASYETPSFIQNVAPSSTITAPASVTALSIGNAASVPDAGTGATYTWGITNGTITSGAGTRTVAFTAGATGSIALSVTVTDFSSLVSVGSQTVTITP